MLFLERNWADGEMETRNDDCDTGLKDLIATESVSLFFSRLDSFAVVVV